MDKNINKKLSKIEDIWNQYILNYGFCNRRIKFTADVQSNYFADITRYFFDSLEIIHLDTEAKTFTKNFEKTISFLQAIYIQQDFIEELLHIFKCNINKGDLKKDLNYSINREIRNELVGHPIRKDKIEGVKKLLSSTIFSNSTSSDNIEYIRYHINNDYKFEKLNYSKLEIIQRHSNFLHTYLDKIIERLNLILSQFHDELVIVENIIKNCSFESIVKRTAHSFEYIFKTNHYNKDFLLEIDNSKRLVHERYEHTSKLFLIDLQNFIKETKENIHELINDTNLMSLPIVNKEVSYEEIYEEGDNKETKHYGRIKYNSLQYVMSKLAIKDFEFITIIEDRFPEEKNIHIEIENMRNNMENNLEYYCSYYYLSELLEKKIKANKLTNL